MRLTVVITFPLIAAIVLHSKSRAPCSCEHGGETVASLVFGDSKGLVSENRRTSERRRVSAFGLRMVS